MTKLRTARFLPVALAIFWLAASSLAVACHNVGDVHVICHDGQNSAIFVANDTPKTETPDSECCPSGALAVPVAISAHAPSWLLMPQDARPQATFYAPTQIHFPRPRGPPSHLSS